MLGATKIYGCLADPIDHVKAPTIFTSIFKEKNIDAVMVPIHVEKDNLENVIDSIKKIKNFHGITATIPHKTTIANLLNGFYNSDSGSISIDGMEISSITRESLYKNISIVTQESILFNDTIMNNIRIGDLDSTDEDIINSVLRTAEEEQFTGYMETIKTIEGKEELFGPSPILN